MRIQQQAIKALDAGLKYFESDKPCKRGHTLRHASRGHCVECKKLNDNSYREENKDSIKAQKKEFAKNNRDRINLLARLRRKNKAERIV